MTATKVIAFSQSYTVIQNLKNLYFFHGDKIFWFFKEGDV
ncbi:Uncharacterised protein [Segatella copri]|nr:Uncharacterised protein [Segatella copri]